MDESTVAPSLQLQSKTLARNIATRTTRSVLECAGPLALSNLPLGHGGVRAYVAIGMKTFGAKSEFNRLTLIELLVVIAVIAILAAMLLPALSDGGLSNRTRCIHNLQQIDLGFIIYADDYDQRFPMQVSAEDGGTKEFTYTGHVFPHFEKLQEYIRPPQLLVCPADKTRHAATNFSALSDLNISYFLNADASFRTNIPSTNNPSHAILLGDRNLALNQQPVNAGSLTVSTNANLDWTDAIHLRKR